MRGREQIIFPLPSATALGDDGGGAEGRGKGAPAAAGAQVVCHGFSMRGWTCGSRCGRGVSDGAEAEGELVKK